MIWVECLTGPRAIKLTNNTDMEVLWTGPSDANGSPVFGGNTVWVMSVTNGKLYALNPTNGAVRQTLNVGHARNFTSPTIAGDKVIVATDFRVQAFKHAG
jgi:outer membrane protein assembly factor BamB